jgi:hypothetical protein
MAGSKSECSDEGATDDDEEDEASVFALIKTTQIQLSKEVKARGKTRKTTVTETSVNNDQEEEEEEEDEKGDGISDEKLRRMKPRERARIKGQRNAAARRNVLRQRRKQQRMEQSKTHGTDPQGHKKRKCWGGSQQTRKRSKKELTLLETFASELSSTQTGRVAEALKIKRPSFYWLNY